MQTGTHCPQHQEVMFESTHSRNLAKPSVVRARLCKHSHTPMQIQTQVLAPVCPNDETFGVWYRHCLLAPQTSTHERRVRAGTLDEMEQNRPLGREQNHRGEEARDAYWYSLQLIIMDTDTLPLRAHTGKQEENQRLWVWEGQGAHFFILKETSAGISLPPPLPLFFSSASHSCICGQTLVAFFSERPHWNKRSGETCRRVRSLKFPERMIPMRSGELIA